MCGIIGYIGGEEGWGHYIAYCKDPITKKWKRYNDTRVEEIGGFAEVQNDICKKNLYCYIMSYRKIHNNTSN